MIVFMAFDANGCVLVSLAVFYLFDRESLTSEVVQFKILRRAIFTSSGCEVLVA